MLVAVIVILILRNRVVQRLLPLQKSRIHPLKELLPIEKEIKKYEEIGYEVIIVELPVKRYSLFHLLFNMVSIMCVLETFKGPESISSQTSDQDG